MIKRRNTLVMIFVFFAFFSYFASAALAASVKVNYDLERPETVIKAFALACINEDVNLFNELYSKDAQRYFRIIALEDARETLFDALYQVKESELLIVRRNSSGDWLLYSTGKARNNDSLGKGGYSLFFKFNRHGKIADISVWFGDLSPVEGGYRIWR
jgi:hypothetical protein